MQISKHPKPHVLSVALLLLSSICFILGAVPDNKAKSGERIKLNHSDLLTYDVSIRPNVQRLIGKVSFSHGTATMTCDSAYLNEKEQTFEAFGNVHMIQADTINMYGQYLHYDGKTKLARLRRQVKLENTTTTLFTDSLDYDRLADMAYYFDGGTIVDPQNTLTSDYGQFFPKTNDAEFRYNVKLVNDSTEMTTHHLFYNTKTRVGRYDGATQIKGDSGLIVSNRGTYDLEQNVGILLDRSEVYSGDRMLVGDSIYYDGTTDFGEAFGSMELHDTLRRASLYGDYGYFDAKRDYGFATSRAYALDYAQKDTLYIGADTLELVSFKQDLLADTTHLYPARIPRDSMQRELRAHRRVRIYRQDAQATADSLTYSSRDSILYLFGKPLLWHEQRQVSGDTVVFLFEHKQLKYTDVLSSSFAIEQMADNKDYYNQIKATHIRTYVQDSIVRKIDALGSQVESIYYMKEGENKDYTGVNRMTSSGMIAWIDSGRPTKVHWSGEVSGKVYPIHMAAREKADKLDGFNWAPERRPKSPEDVIPQDSIVARYTLSDLRKFSGAKAALEIYTPFEQKQAELRKAADSLRQEIRIKASQYKHPYIRKPENGAEPEYLKRSKQLLNITRWQYNPFTDPDDHVPSTTKPYIGILDEKHLTGVSKELGTSSSTKEK